jgi:hypothetical protein
MKGIPGFGRAGGAPLFLLLLGIAGCLTPRAPVSYREEAGGHNSAVTLIEAPAPKIYAAVLRVLQKYAEETVILARNDPHFRIETLKGLQHLNITVTPDGTRGRLAITSDAGRNNSSYTDQALITTQQICYELGVRYTLQ